MSLKWNLNIKSCFYYQHVLLFQTKWCAFYPFTVKNMLLLLIMSVTQKSKDLLQRTKKVGHLKIGPLPEAFRMFLRFIFFSLHAVSHWSSAARSILPVTQWSMALASIEVRCYLLVCFGMSQGEVIQLSKGWRAQVQHPINLIHEPKGHSAIKIN